MPAVVSNPDRVELSLIHIYYVDMSPRMYELKMSMLDKARG